MPEVAAANGRDLARPGSGMEPAMN